MQLQRRVVALQRLQPGQAVQVARRAHADVQMDGVAHALRQSAPHDGQDGRQPGAAGHAQHRALVLAAQVGGAERAAELHAVAHLQGVGDVAGDAPVRHQADVELEQLVAAEARHGIRPGVLRAELKLHVLAGRELDRLGRPQQQALDVVRQVLDGDHAGLDDAGRVHHDLVGFRDLDGAGLGDVGLAGQHEASVAIQRALLLAATLHHLAVQHTAAAGAAAPGHAGVGHRHLRGLQGLQKVHARFDPDAAVERLNEDFHGGRKKMGGSFPLWPIPKIEWRECDVSPTVMEPAWSCPTLT